MNIPVSTATHMISGTEQHYRRITFGNVKTNPFEAIWRAEAYADFRANHLQLNLPEFCRTCARHRMVRALE